MYIITVNMKAKWTPYIYCTTILQSPKVLDKREICTPAFTVIVQGSRSTMLM